MSERNPKMKGSLAKPSSSGAEGIAKLQKCRQFRISLFNDCDDGKSYGDDVVADECLDQAFERMRSPEVWERFISLLGGYNSGDVNAMINKSTYKTHEYPWKTALQQLKHECVSWKNIIRTLMSHNLLRICDEILDVFDVPHEDDCTSCWKPKSEANSSRTSSAKHKEWEENRHKTCEMSGQKATTQPASNPFIPPIQNPLVVPGIATPNYQDSMKLFLTYADDARVEADTLMYELKLNFPNSSIVTHEILSMTEELMFPEMIEITFQNVDFVIPILSQQYLKDVTVEEATNNSDAGAIRYLYVKCLVNLWFDGTVNWKVRAFRLPSFPYQQLKYMPSCMSTAKDKVVDLINVLTYSRRA